MGSVDQIERRVWREERGGQLITKTISGRISLDTGAETAGVIRGVVGNFVLRGWLMSEAVRSSYCLTARAGAPASEGHYPVRRVDSIPDAVARETHPMRRLLRIVADG